MRLCESSPRPSPNLNYQPRNQPTNNDDSTIHRKQNGYSTIPRTHFTEKQSLRSCPTIKIFLCIFIRSFAAIFTFGKKLQRFIVRAQDRITHLQLPTVKCTSFSRIPNPHKSRKAKKPHYRHHDADSLPTLEFYSHRPTELIICIVAIFTWHGIVFLEHLISQARIEPHRF
jgi:hypothetical protein